MRRGLRGFVAMLLAWTVLLSGGMQASAAPVSTLSFSAVSTGYYSVPYGPDLYFFFDTSSIPGGRPNAAYKATYADWAGSGFQTPRPAPTRYLKAPWSPTIFAVHEFVGNVTTGLAVHPLTFAEWQKVGYPTAAVTARIPGAVYTGYSGSPEIDVTNAGETHALTLQEWLAAGSPAPKVVGWKPGAELVRYLTSMPDIFAVAPDGSAHRLTYAEWTAWGFPAFRQTAAEGYYALTWAPEGIAFMGEELSPRQITYSEWAAAAYPSPRMLPTLDNDRYCLDLNAALYRYDGATWSGTMTSAEASATWLQPGIYVPYC